MDVISWNRIGELVKSGNIKGLSQIFMKASNWDTRETAVVAL